MTLVDMMAMNFCVMTQFYTNDFWHTCFHIIFSCLLGNNGRKELAMDGMK